MKSEFESLRKRGRFSEPISRAAELHIISTLRPGNGFRLHDFFFGIPLLFLDLTLPPASPPRSRGLQRHLLSPSRGRAPRQGNRSQTIVRHGARARPWVREHNAQAGLLMQMFITHAQGQRADSNHPPAQTRRARRGRAASCAPPATEGLSSAVAATSGHLKIEILNIPLNTKIICRHGPEKVPNPDGSGRVKFPGFAGRHSLWGS